MQKLVVTAIALTATATSLVTTTTASAGVPVEGPTGLLCGFTAVTNPGYWAPTNEMTGEIHAGPATTDVPGTMVCTIQVNANTHSGRDAVSRAFPSDSSGIIAGVQTAGYQTAEDAEDYLCTSFVRNDGATLFFTGGSNPGWYTYPNQECSVATQSGTQDVWDIVDGALCPELAANAGPGIGRMIDAEGDVFVDKNDSGGTTEAEAMAEIVYDCPTYTFTIDDPSANPDEVYDAVSGAPASNKIID